MIKSLSIQNFAIVSHLEIEFSPGLNILSGETGAGKSIIIGALNLLLGERAQTEMIRTGEKTAVVEGVFSNVSLPSAITKRLDFDSDQIEIRREIRQDRASRCFINGLMVTVGDLHELSGYLVDLVGQHHQQLLLDPSNHITFLDLYAGNSNGLIKYREHFDSYQKSQTELRQLKQSITREREKMELYRFQINEIDSANLSTDEEDELNKKLQLLENAEELKAAYYQSADELYQSDQAICDRLTQIINVLRPMEKFDSELKEYLTQLKSDLYSLQDIGRSLQSRSESIEHDPAELTKIRDRLDTYYELKKKYCSTLEELFSYRNKIEKELSGFEDNSEKTEQLHETVENTRIKLVSMAQKLSENRIRKSTKLARQVEQNLKCLLMDKIEFEVNVTQDEVSDGDCSIENKNYKLSPDGIDQIEFRFSPNPGEDLRPLAKIASGGELSRVLLAIKSILSEKQKASSLIFDEIDTGLGGRAASAISRSLDSLAGDNQVIVITHLQQIAAAGKNHYLVYKENNNGRMVTHIRKLTLKQRKEEIGRMISGERITDLSLKQAEELLKRNN